MRIDLNADLGEGAGHDAELIPLITSANVCCGLHAGNPVIACETLALARTAGIRVGAHPGYADREHFGRRELNLPAAEIRVWCVYQLGGFLSLAASQDMTIQYVKPHGALYNQACREREIARAVVEACSRYNLPVIGLPDSALAAEAAGVVPFVAEGFADRRYRPDGSLVPRDEPDAFLHDPEEAVRQVDWLVREKGVRTICVHGDNPDAVAFTMAVRAALVARGFTLKPFV
jgi:UPF0271 protein